MKRFFLSLVITSFFSFGSQAQCPPGAAALESAYIICPFGCGVLLTNWPQGVLVNIYGGSPLVIVTSATVSGTFGNPGTGSAFVCTPCDTPLVFASSVPNATNGCVIVSGGVVAIKLSSFTASTASGVNALTWASFFEPEHTTYIVQRSTDGKSFVDIATIAGSTGSGQKEYNYKDIPAKQGKYFYRIKITEQNSSIAYSTTIELNSQSVLAISMSPNPVANSFTITLPSPYLPAVIKIYNAQGAPVFSDKTNQPSFTINKSMAKGVYMVKVIGNNNVVTTQKIIKE